MNQENQKFLEDRLFYLGTEKRLFPELEKNMNEGKPEFSLFYSNHHDKDQLKAELHFRKSDTQDMYFLNRYDATLQKPGQQAESRTFHLDNGKGVTMKEAYKLLDGRGVHKELKNKEGEKYEAWVKLDFGNKDEKGNAKLLQYHKNYGYDLHSELFKLPLKHLPSETFNQIVTSLERGNAQAVKMPVDIYPGGSVTLVANPQFKTIEIMDEQGRNLGKEEKNMLYKTAEQQKASITERPNHEKAVEQNMVHEPKPEKTAKASKKEKIESLMPKKNVVQNKGLKI